MEEHFGNNVQYGVSTAGLGTCNDGCNAVNLPIIIEAGYLQQQKYQAGRIM